MHPLLILIPVLLLTLTACSDSNAPQTASSLDLPSYSDAARTFQENSKGKIAPEDLATMQAAAASLAERLPDPGLDFGETAPDFTLPDANNQPVNLRALLDQGPVILVFYRGAWCPYCNMHLHALNESLPAFRRYGAQLVAVTPQQPDKSAEQLKKDNYPFHVLSDLDDRVMKAYRLFYEVDEDLQAVYKKFGIDLEDYNGSERTVLPIPGTFVLDRQGVVRARHAMTDYTQRMEPADIVKALQQL
jgi:peroxiredoxin